MRARDLPLFEYQIHTSLARIELEAEAPLEALAHIGAMRSMDEFVRHVGDRHFPAALEALARLQTGAPDAEAAFSRSLDSLRAGNCRVMASYLQLMRSERDLRAGVFADLPARCGEALEKCAALGRSSEPAWARCLLGLAALRQGDRPEAGKQWRALLPLLQRTGALSAHALRLAEEFAAGLGESLP
jgi:hypothetical protein